MSAGVPARRRRRVFGSDFQWDELIVAGLVALGMPVWVVIGFAIDGLDKHAVAPTITAGDAVPIRVKPVMDMDSPLLKLGGKKRKARLPDMWKPKVEPKAAAIAKQRAFVSTKAKDTTDAIPKGDLEVSDAGTALAPDAAVAADVDVEVDASVAVDAGELGEGGGSAAGSKDGTEADPLKARASSLYHGRILRFLKGGFVCPAAAAGTKCMPSAGVSISGGSVTGFSFRPCGDAAIDAAAKAAIAAKVGQQVPPPPESYPELIPNSFTVTYVCN